MFHMWKVKIHLHPIFEHILNCSKSAPKFSKTDYFFVNFAAIFYTTRRFDFKNKIDGIRRGFLLSSYMEYIESIGLTPKILTFFC
jgi:hypothetical protein